MTYYNNDYSERPEFTFISTPSVLSENLKSIDLNNPFLLLKLRPTCECGKEFRSSGKDKAEAQIVKHLSYKKYANCKPVVTELDYSNVLPTEHTIDQIAGSDANHKRNEVLRRKIDKAQNHEDLLHDSELRQIYGFLLQEDGTIWNMSKGEVKHLALFPKVLDGLQLKNGLNITAKVIAKSQTRLVKNDTLKVSDITLEDATGKITMTLWNEQTSKFKVGDVVKFTNATSKDGQYWGGRGIGYISRTELGAWKNATQIEIISSTEKEIIA